MPELNPLYYVNVGPQGTFKPSGELDTSLADVDALFAYLEQNQVPKLTVHFHGGLVREGSGADVARKMNSLYREAGSHPVSFIWETGLWETVTRNLTTIHETELAQKILKFVVRQVGKRLGIDVGARGPGVPMTDEEIEAELAKKESFAEFEAGARGGAEKLDAATLDALLPEIEADLEEDLTADEELETLLEQEAPRTELLDKDFVDQVEAEGARGFPGSAVLIKVLVQVAYQVLKRYVEKRDHGFYPTVVEEILRALYLADLGQWVWDGMKETAQAMWKPNIEPIGEESHAGTYFLQKLAALKENRPGLIVDLVGHSAGSIAICHLLAAAAARHPGFQVRNVLFLAPGCTMDLFYDEIVTKPERYHAFRMFTMHDDYERKDVLLPAVYTRSLLYLVSGALEETADQPLAGLERHTRGQAPYHDAKLLTVRQFLYAPGQQRLVLSKTEAAPPGLRSQAARHGDFDDVDGPTRESLKFIIEQ